MTDTGVVCVLGVLPSHRRLGIGTELFGAAEEYLHNEGDATLLGRPGQAVRAVLSGQLYGHRMPAFSSAMRRRPLSSREVTEARETTLVLQRRGWTTATSSTSRFATLRGSRSSAVLPRDWRRNVVE